MKEKLITLLCLLTISLLSYAQELNIKSFEEVTRDLTARTQPRIDSIGNKCALIKVQLPIKNVLFKGNVVGDTDFYVNEYWVYMNKGATDLILNVPLYGPIAIVFANWGISYLQNETTYNLIINLPDSHEKPLIAEENGIPLVDLGLSVKWAKYNVGANSPEGNGAYFSWGEIAAKRIYTWKAYKHCRGSEDTIIKYSKKDNKSVLELNDDVAHINWGGNWRLPTKEEFQELINECIWEKEEVNNIKCFKATGPNGNSIYFPTSGYHSASLSSDGGYNTSKLFDKGNEAYYWTSTLGEYEYSAIPFHFEYLAGPTFLFLNSVDRYQGFTIRPVCQ